MENKNVGWLIMGIGAAIMVIVLIFNTVLRNLASQTCSHGSGCSMYDTVSAQMWMSFGIVTVILVIGLAIMFIKPKEKIIIKTVKEKKKKLDLSGLDPDEKKVVELLIEEGKAMFQSDLMERLELGKVGTTRLLDKLEAKQFVERKRRGMNNIVVLKD